MEFLKKQNATLQDEVRSARRSSGNGDGPHIPTMDNERIGRIEGEISGLKHSQTMLLGLVGLVVALVIGFGVYTLQRIDAAGDKLDAVNEKVIALPQQISSELRDLTKTLADVIIATKQAQPPQAPIPTPQQQAPAQSGR